MSSTKPALYNISQCHQMRTKSQPQLTYTENLAKFGHTHTQPFYCWSGICPGPPGSAGTRKVKPRRLKPIWILEQEIVSGSGICWAICKSAPHADNHANIPPLSFLQAGCPSWSCGILIYPSEQTHKQTHDNTFHPYWKQSTNQGLMIYVRLS